jgi:peptidoglycan/LPS O-acetylase OafA/YrhL
VTDQIPTTRSSRIAQVDALRGCAVLLIFFVHYHTLFHPWLPAGSLGQLSTRILEGIARAGTDLFFTLSGFLVYGSLMARDRAVGSYIARRFARIYPTFLFVLGIYLVLSAFDAADSKVPLDDWNAFTYILANLLLLPGILDIQPIVSPAWSLSYLGLFYICAPLLVSGLKLRERTRVQRAALFGGLAAILLVSGFFGGPGRLAMFAGGVLLYEFRPTGLRSQAGVVTALLLGLTFGVLAVLETFGIHPVVRYATLLCLLPLTAAWAMRALPSHGPLFWPWLSYLGQITLSYIMIHGVVLKLVALAAHHWWPPATHGSVVFWTLMLPSLVASAIAAAFVYAAVEDPWDSGLKGPSFRKLFGRGDGLGTGHKPA